MIRKVDYNKSCINKKAFETPKEAQDRIGQIKVSSEGKDEKRPVRAYKCQNCGKWHLSSISADERNEMRKTRIKHMAKEWEEKFGLREGFKKPRKKK